VLFVMCGSLCLFCRCLPNLVTYNIFLRACAQSGEVERVQGFFKEMVAAHIYPDIFSYNGVIDAYGKTGNYDEMEKTLTMMRGEHCKPDLVTYNTLIDAYGRAKAFAKMEQVSILHPSAIVIDQVCVHACNMLIISF
jgi:pentatricopeptide repeat protein